MKPITHHTDLPKEMVTTAISEGFTRYRIAGHTAFLLRKDGPPAAIIHWEFDDPMHGLTRGWTREDFTSAYQMRSYAKGHNLELGKPMPLPIPAELTLSMAPSKLVKKAVKDGFTSYCLGEGPWIRKKHGTTKNPVMRIMCIVVLSCEDGGPAALIRWHEVDLYTVPDDFVWKDFTSEQELQEFLLKWKVKLEPVQSLIS